MISVALLAYLGVGRQGFIIILVVLAAVLIIGMTVLAFWKGLSRNGSRHSSRLTK